MSDIKLNHQIAYYHLNNAKGLAMNLLSFGYVQFADTYLYKNRIQLKELCDNISNAEPSIDLLSGFALNQLIDSIKIHICVENFLKAILLANGFVVHVLDKNYFEEQHITQKKRPINRDEIFGSTKWEENAKVRIDDKKLRLQVKGVLPKTLGTNILLSPGYTKPLGLGQEILKVINPYCEYRNNLHFYTDESFYLSDQNYINLIKLVSFVNLNVVAIQNRIVDELEKGERCKLPNLAF